MISPHGNCPTADSQLPGMVRLWAVLAKEKCHGKRVQIVRAPAAILVVSQLFCPGFNQTSGYFSDVAGDFACR